MGSEVSFSELMARLRAGDEEAAERVYRQFARRLIGLARSRLDSVLRQKEDPEDVVQSVFRSFFARQADGEFNLDDWNGLWSLLTVITLRKCGHRVEYFRAARRNVQREIPTDPPEMEASAGWVALAREPSPAEAVMLAETVEYLMRDLEPRDRTILELSLQGETIPAISDRARCSERTVARIQERVRKKLERLREQQEGD
jgi:RNA polymerase sigma-70 factor (ECF subfamily)